MILIMKTKNSTLVYLVILHNLFCRTLNLMQSFPLDPRLPLIRGLSLIQRLPLNPQLQIDQLSANLQYLLETEDTEEDMQVSHNETSQQTIRRLTQALRIESSKKEHLEQENARITKELEDSFVRNNQLSSQFFSLKKDYQLLIIQKNHLEGLARNQKWQQKSRRELKEHLDRQIATNYNLQKENVEKGNELRRKKLQIENSENSKRYFQTSYQKMAQENFQQKEQIENLKRSLRLEIAEKENLQRREKMEKDSISRNICGILQKYREINEILQSVNSQSGCQENQTVRY